MKRAIIIKADASPPFIKEIASQETTYEIIKETVASEHSDWFDCVRGESYHGYVNDTGLIDGLHVNLIASILFGQVICGNVILFGSFSPKGEYDGDEYDIPEFVWASVKSHWSLWKTNMDALAEKLQIDAIRGLS